MSCIGQHLQVLRNQANDAAGSQQKTTPERIQFSCGQQPKNSKKKDVAPFLPNEIETLRNRARLWKVKRQSRQQVT
jgi:hypothetical protein